MSVNTVVFCLLGFPLGTLFVSAIFRAREGDLVLAVWHIFNAIVLMIASAILIFWVKL